MLTYGLQIPHPECVGFLLGKGAAIEPKDRSGFTPLVLAVQLGCEESIRLLLARGANVQVRAGDGRTLQEIASEANTYQGECLLICFLCYKYALLIDLACSPTKGNEAQQLRAHSRADSGWRCGAGR